MSVSVLKSHTVHYPFVSNRIHLIPTLFKRRRRTYLIAILPTHYLAAKVLVLALG
jgi:hypothetical protein